MRGGSLESLRMFRIVTLLLMAEGVIFCSREKDVRHGLLSQAPITPTQRALERPQGWCLFIKKKARGLDQEN
jgi:hypothetical protein